MLGGYAEIVAPIFLCLFILVWHWRSWNKYSPIINWPLLGMLPGFLQNAQHFHEYTTRVLKHYGGTWEFKGPCFGNMEFVFLSDPTNIHHILSRNFSNYHKGPKFREVFEPFGDGIINSDSDSWRYQRRLIQSMVKNKKFELFLEKVSRGKVESSLIPILDHVSSAGIEVDLQDLFQRYTFDNVCFLVLGFDPKCLSIEFPQVAHAKAFDQMEQSVFYRHVVPESCWKLQRWLQIGEEKKLSVAWKFFDEFLYQCISSKREEIARNRTQKMEEEANFDLLTACIELEQDEEGGEILMDRTCTKSDKFLRDMAFVLIGAGRDTVSSGLTWFLWLVTTHPSVEAKILQEMREHLVVNNEREMNWDIKEISKLVYLHAAICESLRLFPPIPFEHLYAIDSDILPSGHPIGPSTKILYSPYAMGRTESIWGEDCLEFKPERWISEKGKIVHVPSYKFITFNAGPRTCLGKDMSFIQMKTVASTIIWNYRLQVVEAHPVLPKISIVLHMRHGLKVRVTKRDH
ncbi:alkane hydroxylase MAH1-like [Corylus avellana]|uniref:alkane hydroxylase MAH1-like n=1 Tax=Corylus avellana TaxID=13451 RepID=UPI00286BDE99|nr:alkane hydroxylase MAH1-like [Corylus avellana]